MILGRSLRLAAFVMILGSASAAQAQSATPSGVTVESLLRDGVELRREGRDADALMVFRRAHELGPDNPIAAAQLGLAEQSVGRWLPADAHVHEALAATDNAWIAQNREALEHAYEIIRTHVGELQVLSNREGASVSVDGEPAGTLPMRTPIHVVAGDVTLEVTAPGYYPVSRRIAVTTHGVTRETVQLRERHGGDRGSLLRTLAIVSGVTAGALLVGSVILLGVRESQVSAYNGDPNCPGTASNVQPDACASRVGTVNTTTGFAVAGFVGTGLLAAASVALFTVSGSESGRHGFAGLTCAPGPGTVGVACAIRY